MSWIRNDNSDNDGHSQRRVEKRRSEIESKAMKYRDEQERVQKKTFTNWINTYLIQCQPPCKIADLFPEVKDGTKLLLLLEVLSGQKLPKESRKTMQRVHCLSNVRTALSFLEGKNIKLVNINPADIVDGKPSIVLGLIWTIILYFQIEEQEDTIMKSLEGTELAERGEKFKGSAKKALLAWAQNNLGDKYAIDIRDFGNSWRDGSAFNAMVHNIDPSLVDMEGIGDRSNRENLEAAFAAAESGLNIPRLIDPEDVDVDKPDEKSIMTYVAQFLKAYPEGSKKKPKLLEQPCGNCCCCCAGCTAGATACHQGSSTCCCREGRDGQLLRQPSAYDLTCSHEDDSNQGACGCEDCSARQMEFFATFGTVRAASRSSSMRSAQAEARLDTLSEEPMSSDLESTCTTVSSIGADRQSSPTDGCSSCSLSPNLLLSPPVPFAAFAVRRELREAGAGCQLEMALLQVDDEGGVLVC